MLLCARQDVLSQSVARSSQVSSTLSLLPVSLSVCLSLLQTRTWISSHTLGKAQNGFALTRPPGHHARRSSTGGFCLLNNIAIAINDLFAQQSLAPPGCSESEKIERILVFDWDVHHGKLTPSPFPAVAFLLPRPHQRLGDGLQEIFYEDERVLYISIHRHEHQPGVFYESDGHLLARGSGTGFGYNINLPLSYRPGGYDDKDYDYLLQELVLPISRQYDPQLIIIAAGYDACANDPVGGNKITPKWFGNATKIFQVSFLFCLLSTSLVPLSLSSHLPVSSRVFLSQGKGNAVFGRWL
jgi:acetoin utilization deacetylase AcuC-like enzyme